MKHDELLANIDYFLEYEPKESPEWAGTGIFIAKKLRAVVDLHKPWINLEGKIVCAECCNYGADRYPCITQKTIEKELLNV